MSHLQIHLADMNGKSCWETNLRKPLALIIGGEAEGTSEALLKLAEFTGEGNYRALAEKSLRLVAGMATRFPTAFGRWLSAADFALGNVKQVAVVYEAGDEGASGLIRVIQSQYRPNVLLAASPYPPSQDAPVLLKDRPLKDGRPTVYVCEGFVCKNPVATAEELQNLI